MAEEWISLGEAAKILGVHPTTVRNWADQGDLPFRRTPGRHRRFSRAVVEDWASRQKLPDKPSTANLTPHAQVLMEFALGHTRFSMEESDLQQQGWYSNLSAETKQKSREFGRRILAALMRHLQEQYPEGEELVEAQTIGSEYADVLRAEGLTLVQAIQGYTYFDDFLIEAVIQMMSPNMGNAPSEWSDLLRQINAFTNEVLAALTKRYLEQG